MIAMIRTSIDHLDIYQITEILQAVQYQYGLSTLMETREKVEAGEYTKEEIMEAIAYRRTDGMGTHRDRMNYLPISLEGVVMDYTGLLY